MGAEHPARTEGVPPLKNDPQSPNHVRVTDAAGATLADFELKMGTDAVACYGSIGKVTSVSPNHLGTTFDRHDDGTNPIGYVLMNEREDFASTAIPAFPGALAGLTLVVVPGDIVVIAPSR